MNNITKHIYMNNITKHIYMNNITKHIYMNNIKKCHIFINYMIFLDKKKNSRSSLYNLQCMLVCDICCTKRTLLSWQLSFFQHLMTNMYFGAGQKHIVLITLVEAVFYCTEPQTVAIKS